MNTHMHTHTRTHTYAPAHTHIVCKKSGFVIKHVCETTYVHNVVQRMIHSRLCTHTNTHTHERNEDTHALTLSPPTHTFRLTRTHTHTQRCIRLDRESTKLYMLYCWVYLAYMVVAGLLISIAATQLGTMLDANWPEVREQIEKAMNKELTDKEAQEMHENLRHAAELLAFVVPIAVAIKLLFNTYFTYIVWSFKARLERGDQGTILTGVEGSTAVLPAYMNTLPQPYTTYATYPQNTNPPPHNPTLPPNAAPYTATYNPVMYPGAAPVVSQHMGSVQPQGGARTLSPTGNNS
eukprot:GDKI01039046.1.p1 GENE.GDKI01039046.1~~GDKI01039046.1.p1  ORF type:complete len:293 (+),score=89.36 GDKI01039046.1:171-1049(+)